MASHFIAAAKLNTTVIDGLQNSTVSPGVETILAGGDSIPYNSWSSIEAIRPQAQIASVKIGSLLDLFGITPYEISANPLELYTVSADHGGTRATTGEKINITAGVVVPLTLEAALGSPPLITYGVFMGNESGTVPYAATSAQTIPTGAEVDELWRIGDVDVNSSSIGPVVSYSIDFGFAVQQDIDPESLYPTLVVVQINQPRITVRTKMTTALVTLTVDGTDSVMALTLQARTQGGGIAGSGHKTFSTHRNLIHVASLGGSHNERAITEVLCEPVYDGTNAPITVA